LGCVMIDSTGVKDLVERMGADLCGIAPVERFGEAPAGFHPTDIYAECRAVVVFAKRVPRESLLASSCVPYTYVGSMVTQILDRLAFEASLSLEEQGIGAVPIPSDDPYEHWEPARSYGRAILSLRHAGHLAGLGVLGKNTLLINKRLGNTIELGAILVDVELEGDPIATYEGCLPNCQLCIDSCPQGALDGQTANQQLCRPLSNCKTEKGYTLMKCNLCRRICPSCLGIKPQEVLYHAKVQNFRLSG
jgi:epoxyqueuosine reductase